MNIFLYNAINGKNESIERSFLKCRYIYNIFMILKKICTTKLKCGEQKQTEICLIL